MKRTVRRVFIVLVAIVGVLVVLGVVLFAFGGPVAPSPEAKAEYASLQAKGSVPAASADHFVIPVPGCVCHSTDSVQIVQHAEYRLRECSSCH